MHHERQKWLCCLEALLICWCGKERPLFFCAPFSLHFICAPDCRIVQWILKLLLSAYRWFAITKGWKVKQADELEMFLQWSFLDFYQWAWRNFNYCWFAICWNGTLASARATLQQSAQPPGVSPTPCTARRTPTLPRWLHPPCLVRVLRNILS